MRNDPNAGMTRRRVVAQLGSGIAASMLLAACDAGGGGATETKSKEPVKLVFFTDWVEPERYAAINKVVAQYQM